MIPYSLIALSAWLSSFLQIIWLTACNSLTWSYWIINSTWLSVLSVLIWFTLHRNWLLGWRPSLPFCSSQSPHLSRITILLWHCYLPRLIHKNLKLILWFHALPKFFNLFFTISLTAPNRCVCKSILVLTLSYPHCLHAWIFEYVISSKMLASSCFWVWKPDYF